MNYALLYHLLLMGLVLLLARKNREKKILVCSLLIALITQAGNFFASLFSCLALFFLHTFRHIAVPFFNDLACGCIDCCSLLSVALLLCFLNKLLKAVFDGKPPKWYLAAAAPLLLTTAIIDLVNLGVCRGILVRGTETMGPYYDQLFSHANICLLSALSMFATGSYLYGMHRIYMEQEKSSQYRTQIAAYQVVEEQYHLTERLRHDLKNHILALMELLEEKEWDAANAYLKNMAGNTGFMETEILTGNHVADVLLSQKGKLAKEKNIVWECDVRMPKPCPVSEFDLCILFGNILDNAIEACERLSDCPAPDTAAPFIHIQGQLVKKCFLLEVKNSASISQNHSRHTANHKTAARHGIGLLNVRDTAEKYNGIVNTDLQNGVFTISLLIPFEKAEHDNRQGV